jgi:hypothetical protein
MGKKSFRPETAAEPGYPAHLQRLRLGLAGLGAAATAVFSCGGSPPCYHCDDYYCTVDAPDGGVHVGENIRCADGTLRCMTYDGYATPPSGNVCEAPAEGADAGPATQK